MLVFRTFKQGFSETRKGPTHSTATVSIVVVPIEIDVRCGLSRGNVVHHCSAKQVMSVVRTVCGILSQPSGSATTSRTLCTSRHALL